MPAAVMLFVLSPLTFAAPALDWLATQQQADGSFIATPSTLATPVQTTAEVLRTYQALGETGQTPYGPALDYLNSDPESNTEYLARKLIINQQAGNPILVTLDALIANQNPDGGFGDQPGYDSSVYDTALALEAMALTGYPLGEDAAGAVGYLMNHQLGSGGWVDGDNEPSIYVTALVLAALAHYREDYIGVAATVGRAQDFLFSERLPDGTWGESFVTASAMLALLAVIPDRALLDASVVALANAQLANGSWQDDVYTTALALRAIHAYDTHVGEPPSDPGAPPPPEPGPPAPDKGAITGYTIKAGSNEPLTGATLTITELPGVTVQSGSAGAFTLAKLDPGRYTVVASKPGYSTASVVTSVVAGEVSQVGNLVLAVLPTTGVVRGTVRDADFGDGLVDVIVTLSGPAEYFTSSDGIGNFDLGAVGPGDYTVTFRRTNYNTVTAPVRVVAGQISALSVSLTREGIYDDRPSPVFGQVVNGETGAPLAGALVDLGNGQSATTDTDGSFLIADVARDSYNGTVTANGFQTLPFTWFFSPVCSGNLGRFALYPAVENPPPTTLTVLGTVVDAQTLAPIAGASVSVTGTGISDVSDASGAVKLSGIQDTTFQVSASVSGYQTGIYNIKASGFGTAKATFTLAVDTGQPEPDPDALYGATGIVLDASTNQPLAGATVAGLFGGSQYATTTSADGRFTLTNVTTAEGDIQVAQAGYLSQTVRVTLAPLNITDLGQIRLRAETDPLPDLVVSAVNAQGTSTDPHTLEVSGEVTATVANSGTAGTGVPVSVLVFYDNDENDRYEEGVDTFLGQTVSVNALEAEASEDVIIPIGGSLPFRDAPIHVWVDSSQLEEERDEENNVGVSSSACKYVADPGTFKPVPKWEWTGSTVLPEFNQVMSIPIVASLEDTNGDGAINQKDISAVIFHSYTGGNFRSNGVLRALSGKDGNELWTVTEQAYRTNPEGSIAVADIDGDGIIEIIAPKNGGGIIVFEHTGEYKWQSAEPSTVFWGGAAISDLNGDGTPEIVVGNTVLNADGSLRWQGSGYVGSNGLGPLSVVADINLDGIPEVVAGAAAYSSDGQRLWQNSSVGDGFIAVGNFNEDPYPEIVVVSTGRLFLLDYQGNVIWGPVSLPGGGRGGAPTVADVDGDDIPEIGVAGASSYSVFKADGAVLWSAPTSDRSSNMTGSSVFDFDGDGRVEVVYADEVFLRVYRGSDGIVLFDTPNSSGTTYELPVIADIDNDEHADVVICANQLRGGIHKGIRVFQGKNNTWVNTRKIWNQHSYHITNINDDGTVPAVEQNSWQIHNTYRLNTQPGVSVTGVPDLTTSLLRVVDNGPGQPLGLQVRVGNGGASDASDGIPVAFYEGDPATGGVLLGSVVSGSLAPGEYRDAALNNVTGLTGTADIYAVVDPENSVVECDETNNTIDIPPPTILPDLIVSAVDATGASTDPATLQLTGSVAATVKNQGNKKAEGNIDLLAFYDVDRNEQYDIGGDLVLGRATLAQGLTVGASQMVEITLQGNMSFRDAPIKVWVDSTQRIAELVEHNNTKTSAGVCRIVPEPGQFEPVVKFQALRGVNVIATPMVANLTDDNGDSVINEADIPDIVVPTMPGSQFAGGPIKAVSGDDGRELFTTTPDHLVAALNEIAIGDIDGDGLPEIVAARWDGYNLLAFEHTGELKWVSEPHVLPGRYDSAGAISIANLDGAGAPEIVIGASVYDADGKFLADGRDLGGTSAFNYYTAISAVADINLDGIPEIIAGPAVYRFVNGVLELLWRRTDVYDGFVGIANFDADPYAEIVIVGIGRVYMLNHDGTNAEIWAPDANGRVTLRSGGYGGAPTISDFDGDGTPEIGIAGRIEYFVFETDGALKWSAATRDYSSNTTGSTSFDFEGDGVAEIIYRDELALRIYRGTDGVVLYDMPLRSGTATELPVVADVDNDGHAELIVCSDRVFGGTVDDTGIYVLEDANDSWANTRKIWNQHSYHITNINDDGTVPRVEQNSWQVHNTYRLNAQPGLTGSETPDLTAALLTLIDHGAGQPLSVSLRVGNGGVVASPADVVVSAYEGDPLAGGTLLGSVTIDALAAGGYRDVRIDGILNYAGGDVYAVVDAGDQVAECREDNNTVSIPGQAQVSLRGLISVATDKPVYGPDSPVVLQGLVTNAGALVGDYVAELRVEDTQGVLVAGAGFPGHAINQLASGGAITLTDAWHTQGIVAGSYRLRGILRGVDGKVLAQASSAFEIRNSEVDEPAVTLRTTTDKPVYHTHDTVSIEDLVQNVSANTLVRGARLQVTVTDPDGGVIYSNTQALNELGPGAQRTVFDAPTLNGALEGSYQVLGDVLDAASEVLASGTAAFAVQAALDKQLSGAVSAQAPVLEAGQTQSCAYTLTNTGSTAVAGLEIHYTVVDIIGQTTVSDDLASVSLAPAAQTTATRAFTTRGLDGHYACVLQARIDNALKTLAYAPFQVLPPPIEIEAELSVGHRGRLLVLLDGPKGGGDGEKCKGVTQLDLSTAFDPALAPQATVEVSVLNKSGVVLDQEAIALAGVTVPVNANGGSDGVDLSLTALTDSGLTLSVREAGSAKGKLGTEYGFLATVYVDGNALKKESGPIHTSCSQPIAVGDVYGAFTIRELVTLSAANDPKTDDPHGPKQAPDLDAQRDFIEALLSEAGWSYTLTETAEAFTRELHSGGYALYALFNEREKLSEQAQQALREAVYRGEGLLVAGPHDNRNTHKEKLGDALGLKVHGHHSKASAVALPEGALSDTAGTVALLHKDKALKLELLTAEPLAHYEGIELKANNKYSDAAVTLNTYGEGKGLFAGFDWLATATGEGHDSLAAQALLNALAQVSPADLSTMPGTVLPLDLTLTNKGIATTARVTLNLPAGTTVIDAPGAEHDDTQVVWDLALEQDQVRTLALYLRLPDTDGSMTLTGTVTAPVVDGDPGALQAELSLTVEVQPVPDAGDLTAALDSLPDKLKKKVEKHIDHANKELPDDPDKALKEVLKAADELVKADPTPESHAVRLTLARWVRWLAMQLL